MENKLTLKLSTEVIERAKVYAKKKNISLSKLIEAYLGYLTNPKKDELNDVSPLVRSLSGIIKSQAAEPKVKYKKHLSRKYGK
jgi:hypothetical protein